MTVRSRLAARTGSAFFALALAAGATVAAPAHADPALPDLSTLGALQSLSLYNVPGDAELAEALRTLKTAGLDQQGITALTTILGAQGSPDLSTLGQGLRDGLTSPGTPGLPTAPANPTAPDVPAAPAPAPGETAPDATAPDTATPDAAADPASAADPALPAPNPAAAVPTVAVPTAAVPVSAAPTPAASAPGAAPVADPLTSAAGGLDLFEKISGAKLLTPALAPFCAPVTAENPLGLAAAPAIALPGPFPRGADGKSVKDSFTTLLGTFGIPELGQLLDGPEVKDLTEALNAQQTAYALVPPTGTTSDAFQVAWFNLGTMKGGTAALTTLDKVTGSTALKALVGSAPVRLARVDTGQGAILTAVFGTADKDGRTCYFLPAVGIVDTPAT